MEKGRDTNSLRLQKKLDRVNPTSEDHKSNSSIFPAFYSTSLQLKKMKPPSLVNLCLGVVGKHFEDIVEDLADIAANLPTDIKLTMAAIARRRKLLNDNILIHLAESSWEIVDLSGSDVSDFGLVKLTSICHRLRAIDISGCLRITPVGVFEVLQHCRRLEILRCGGCSQSDYVAHVSAGLLKPKIEDMDGESWEDFDTMEFTHAAPSLRWLIWPNIDKDSMERLWMECPRIVVNPKASDPFGYRGGEIIPSEAVDVELDEAFVKEVNPKTWSVCSSNHDDDDDDHDNDQKEEECISVAEKFRLAYLERDTRLAPKRAKNARQRQRRAEREMAGETGTMGKALAVASKMAATAGKSSCLHHHQG